MSNSIPELFPGKHFISSVLEALHTKSAMTRRMWRVYLMRAAMAGVIIGVMYLTYLAVLASFSHLGPQFMPIGKLVGSAVFGFALVFIYYSKSELLTSNMMIVSIGLYYRKTSVLRAGWILALCLVGNLLGGFLVAGLLAGSTLADGTIAPILADTVATKLAYLDGGGAGILDLFVRAILCNFMINLAMLLIYNGLVRDDFTKSLVMIVSVLIFAYVGFEHSVANAVLFGISGLQTGIEVTAALANVGIVILGNFLGGGVLIGLYYAYANDSDRHMRPSDRDLPKTPTPTLH